MYILRCPIMRSVETVDDNVCVIGRLANGIITVAVEVGQQVLGERVVRLVHQLEAPDIRQGCPSGRHEAQDLHLLNEHQHASDAKGQQHRK